MATAATEISSTESKPNVGRIEEIQGVVVAWQIYALTGRPLDLGLVGLAQFLPGIFLFLAAGHTADHYHRRRILEVCYAAFALCSVNRYR